MNNLKNIDIKMISKLTSMISSNGISPEQNVNEELLDEKLPDTEKLKPGNSPRADNKSVKSGIGKVYLNILLG